MYYQSQNGQRAQSLKPSFTQSFDYKILPSFKPKERVPHSPQFRLGQQGATGEPLKFNAQTPVMQNRAFSRMGGADQIIFDKKRDYMDFHNNSFNVPRNIQQQTPAQNTPFYTFEDSSTVKPQDNTVIRNPTLLLKYANNEKPAYLNRSVHILPVNLGKIEFEKNKYENESQFISARGTPQLLQKQQKDREHTTKEISDFCMRVSIIVNDLMNSEADIRVHNIAQNQSEGKLYEIIPHLFSITSTHRLPPVIKREINDQEIRPSTYVDYGFLEDSSIAYFCFDKNLYLWSFPQLSPGDFARGSVDAPPLKYEFDQMVTAVSLSVPLPGMEFKNPDQRILIVATVTEIKVFNFLFHQRDSRIELIDTNFSVPTDQNVVSKIIQLKKNGRVFYGGSSGHVHELKYQDDKQFDIFSLLQGDRKRLKKNDLQQENMIRKILPGFLKFTENKQVTDIKIDEYRNILYSVCMSLDQSTLDETIIEVFDLGVFGNKFQKLTTLRQQQITEMMLEFWQRENLRRQDITKLNEDWKIVYIQPISVSESDQWHLVIVTENGLRVYIHFEQSTTQTPSDEEMQQERVNPEYLFLNRFTPRWRIEEIMSFPDQDTFNEMHLLNKMNSAITGGQVQSCAQRLKLQNQAVHYDSNDGVIAFVQQSKNYFGDPLSVDSNDAIVMNYIKRNESSLAYNRLVNESSVSQNFCRLIECFSQLPIPLEKVLVRNQTPSKHREDPYDYMTENVIEMQSNKKVISAEIAKLIGFNKSYFESKGVDVQTLYETLPLSEFEKQVYYQAPQINVLTDNRVITIQQLRPIDLLAMLIHTMTTDTRSLYQQYDNLEEFLDLYTVRETCGMLLQMIVDKATVFTFSKKVEDNLKQAKNKDQYMSQPSQLMSKSQQIIRNRRGSLADISGYQSKQDQQDHIRFRILSQEERQTALQLLKKYGDSIVFIKQSYDIPEDSLEGMPQNIQDFSIKHFVLYQYLQRVLRPVWNSKIAYKQFDKSEFKPTFDSLNVPRKKLMDIYDFIEAYSQILAGQIYAPSSKPGSEDRFVKNTALLNIIQPVYKLTNSDKDKLELMEKNSLKNLKFFIIRCIQAIDMLSILTFNNDQKMFASLQKAIGDKDSLTLFSNLSFKDLITMESNSLIKRFLEAAIKVESDGSEDSHHVLKQKYANISKSCSTFFSKNENIAFIGVTLLQAAKKEKNFQRKEELLKQAIEHLVSQPLNIDMQTVPQLLVENGNYSSLADLILRKIKALESMSKEQKQRLMSDLQYQEQLNQCYSIIISLFAAIDQSVQKETYQSDDKDQDLIKYFLQKLNMVTNRELKQGLRDKILKRIEQFNDEVVLTAIFDYLMSKPSTLLNVDCLPQVQPKTLTRIFDETLRQDAIKVTKFDAIHKIMMKKMDSERLATISINACLDQYPLITDDGQPFRMNLDKKLQLLATARTLIDLQKDKEQPEIIRSLEGTIKQIEKNIEIQYLVKQELENDVSQEYIQGRETQFQNLMQDLMWKYHDSRTLHDIAKSWSLYNTILCIITHNKQNVENDLMKIIPTMISYYFRYFPQTLEYRLFPKQAVLSPYPNAHWTFLLHVQQNMQLMHAQDDPNILLEQLLNNSTIFRNTRFDFLSYCIQNQVLPPFQLITRFVPQYQQFHYDESRGEPLTVDMIDFVAIIKMTISKNQQLYANQPPKYGDTFSADIQRLGRDIYTAMSEVAKIMSEDNLLLSEQTMQMITQFVPQLKSDFEQLLVMHNVNIPDLNQQAVIIQERSFLQPIGRNMSAIDENPPHEESEDEPNNPFMASNDQSNSRENDSGLRY